MPSVDTNNNAQHSKPIPIENHRRRSHSISETSSSDSSVSPSSPITPTSTLYPHVGGAISPSSSPILSYLLAQSPNKSPAATFPFRRGFGAPVIEDDEDGEIGSLVSRHARRASTNTWSTERFTQPPSVAPLPNEQHDRAAGLLRRLSLGGSMTRPVIQNPRMPNATVGGAPGGPVRRNSPPIVPGSAAGAAALPARKTRRANTLGPGAPKPPRAPSPMGERILKGHFDGFN